MIQPRVEIDKVVMEMLKRVARGVFGAPGNVRFAACYSARPLQVPIMDEDCVPYAWTEKYTLEYELPTFHTESIELERFPTWFMGKFYDLYAGYGPESKLVAWRLGNYQW